jgi:hypothetical protein
MTILLAWGARLTGAGQIAAAGPDSGAFTEDRSPDRRRRRPAALDVGTGHRRREGRVGFVRGSLRACATSASAAACLDGMPYRLRRQRPPTLDDPERATTRTERLRPRQRAAYRTLLH